jgi:hypothetical protein
LNSFTSDIALSVATFMVFSPSYSSAHPGFGAGEARAPNR